MKLLVRSLAILGFVEAMHSWTEPAAARHACTTYADARERLGNQFDERVVGRDLANAGKRMIELLVSAKGSWTVVASESNGRSCVLASGVSGQQLPLLVGDPA